MFTERLVLTPVSLDMRLAMHSSRNAFAALLDIALPEGWPQFPQAFAVGWDTNPAPWSGYLFAEHETCTLVGNGGFVGPPDESGTVEIGYEIAPAFRLNGYATEAARALMEKAFAAGARAVIAHSLPAPNASNAVMRKLGMQLVGEIGQRDQKVWRWRRPNPALTHFAFDSQELFPMSLSLGDSDTGPM